MEGFFLLRTSYRPSEMDSSRDLHEISARSFVEHCRVKFRWGDLSTDVIMDVGCGEQWNCGKVILEKFPDVKAIIGIDCDPQVTGKFTQRSEKKLQYVLANIEKRESLQKYQGQMTKVISTFVFHQLEEKEEAFRNMYHLLKPGGEAAVLFIIKSLLYEWITEMRKKPKWIDGFKRHYAKDLYPKGFGAVQYREMVEKIGFQVIECKEEENIIPYLSDQACKESLYDMGEYNFNVPSELLEEFKEECFQTHLKLSARDAEGKPCYRSTKLSLLLIKPIEGAVSETKE